MSSISVTLLAWILIVLLACTAFEPEKFPESELVFFGFNEVFMGQWSANSFTLKPLSFPALIHKVAGVAKGTHEDELILLGVDGDNRKFGVFVFKPSAGTLARILDQNSIEKIHTTFGPSIALAPSGNQIAFLSFGAVRPVSKDFKHREVTVNLEDGARTITTQNVWLYDLMSHRSTLLAKEEAIGATSLSWAPSGQTLTFDSIDGFIKSVDIKTHDVSKAARGRMPAWSPDGKQLAYVEDKTLVIKDVMNGLTRTIYKRWFWQSDFAEHLSWSPDGRYLAFNVYAGMAGYEYDCLVTEISSARSFSVHTSSYFCGPWVKNKRP